MSASITLVNQVILLLNFYLSNKFQYTIIGMATTEITFHYFPSLGLRECIVISMLYVENSAIYFLFREGIAS